MFQRFNSDTLMTKFIKNLLRTVYVPTVNIWNKGDNVVKDLTYITSEYIIKAKRNYPNQELHVGTAPTGPLDPNYFDVIGPYVHGNYYKGITTNFESTTSYYDSETHYHLGQYLRMVRDLSDINLMPYYNCWNNVFSDKIRINKNSNEVNIIQNNTLNDGYKTLIVPIKFNKKYTFYFNTNIPFQIIPVYYNNINITINNLITNYNTYKLVNRCSNNQPYVYEGLNTSEYRLARNYNNESELIEDYLVLLIQVPESVSSSIVILEGDYSSTKLINIMNDTKKLVNKLPETYFDLTGITLDDIPKTDFESYFKSVPYLTRTITQKNYAFSDRLIEYLLDNPITKNDYFTDNIQRIQEYNSSYKSLQLNNKRLIDYSFIKGVWNRKLRKYNYDLATQYKYPLSFDINGYVDKDTEELILRGKS